MDCEAVLLTNSRNAFNSFNRRAALLNIHNLCPFLAIILTNCYQSDVPLFIDDNIIFSSEGTTQGDPLAMVMYAIGILPLIHCLNRTSVHQVWYADNAAALGSCPQYNPGGRSFGVMVLYLDTMQSPLSLWLIVKREIEDTACSVFGDIDINVTSEWVSRLEKFTTVAQTQPHVSFSGLIHGFFNKLVYLCRTTLGVCQHIHPLEDCLRRRLIPF